MPATVCHTSGSSPIPRWVERTSTCRAPGVVRSRQAGQSTTLSRRVKIAVTGTRIGSARSSASARSRIRRLCASPYAPAPIVKEGPPTTGVPKVTTWLTASGTARAVSRATRPPRLQPTSATARPVPACSAVTTSVISATSRSGLPWLTPSPQPRVSWPIPRR